MIQDVFNAATSGISGSAQGASMGAAAGPYGAIAGAAIGGTIGTATGVTDAVMNQAARAEDRDLRVDMFGYRLGNIKALPNTITSIDTFDYQNPIWPYIEVYDCTDTEKEALRMKIKYNGMTNMTINIINTVVNLANKDCPYVKGQIIQFPKDASNNGDDAHIRSAIYGEFNQGLYWYNNVSDYGG